MTYPGTLLLVLGAAGSGKGVLLRRAKELHPEIVFPISATTRQKRPTEVDGVTYHFVTEEEFKREIDAGEFMEWAMIDGGKRYGTPRNEVIPALEAGKVVMEELEIQGLRQMQQLIPKENLVTIYIDAGGWDALSRRIQGRAPISEEELESRRKRFEYEKKFKEEADYIVENFDGKVKEADRAFEAIIQKYLPSA